MPTHATPALVVIGGPPPPACYEHHNLVRVERYLLRGTSSFLTIRDTDNRLPARASEPYEELARARGVSVACILLNVIAIRCRLANITGQSSEESGVPHQPRLASYANLSELRTPEISQRGSPSPRGGLA